jgi:hypothetical protein
LAAASLSLAWAMNFSRSSLPPPAPMARHNLPNSELEDDFGAVAVEGPPPQPRAKMLNAARFIHWCETHEEVRQLMLAEAVRTAKEKLIQQNRARPLKWTKHPDPLDTLCVAIIDILHHEGSKFAKVDDILKSVADEDAALEALCQAGVDDGRNQKLLHGIRDLKDKGKLGKMHFSDLIEKL